MTSRPPSGDGTSAESSPAGSAGGTTAAHDDVPDRAVDQIELTGPALENEAVRRATADLQSSQDKTAQARKYAADVRKQTLPGTSPTGL